MFERFTDRARRVVVLAQEEARLLNHNYIGTEHLLLGLLSEGEGVAAQTLVSLDIALETVRGRVEEIIGEGKSSPSEHIPFTPRAKKVLELSLREALQLGHAYIGTEHLLLGLVREGQGVGAQVLVEMGADLRRVRQEIVGIIGSGLSEEIEGDPADVEGTGNPDLVIESLAGEVRRLRREVDRLRGELRRTDPGSAPLGAAPLPGLDEPPRASPEAPGAPAGPEASVPTSGGPPAPGAPAGPEASVPTSGGPPATGPEASQPASREPPAYHGVLSCSFCSEPQDRVTKLIAGPGVYICDRCIGLCQEILDEELGRPEAGPPSDSPD